MGFFEMLGIFVSVYYVINFILYGILDSDIELAFKEKFGRPISRLRGRVVWITGASSGIGKQLAICLAKYGVRLAISSTRENELLKVKEECLECCSGLLANDDILVLPMNMLHLDMHQKYFNTVVNHFGKLDILVNNAGRSQRANWDEIEIDVDKALFELNVFSVINLSRLAVKYFKTSAGGRGHIAVTSSGAGLIPVPFSASYTGAKHAIHGYFGSLKIEEPTLDVTIFCPGPIATNFLEQSFTGKPDVKYGIAVSPDDRRMSAERCGQLFAISLANKCLISWAGIFPLSILLYISQLYPNIRLVLLKVLGKRGMKKIREGK